MRTPLLLTVLTSWVVALAPAGSHAASVVPSAPAAIPPAPANDPSGVEFFEKRIRPVLVQQCYKCHASTSEKVKGGLLLDTRANALTGGETGPAVVPGHPEKSLLIEAVNYTNEDVKMPPKNRLPANVVADLTKWVQMGAPWPEDKGAVVQHPVSPSNAARYDQLRKEHWAWQPIKDPVLPTVKDTSWPHNDVDHFVLAHLESKGLKPVADADKATLIRRVTFDLTGLPPSPEDVAAFVADSAPDAYAKRVDQLLASRAFGERWGRHWLDIARYGESTGSSRNVPYNFAWRYRDYVIDSFNKDKPFNRFITEQIAGDLMPAGTTREHNEQLIATGFLAIGVKDLNERDRVKFTMDSVDEQIDVTTRSIMALTVACARCHDHKFDPIPTVDYYSLAGIFRSTEILSGLHGRTKAAKKQYGAPELLYHLDDVPAPATIALPPAADSAGKIRRLEAKADSLRAQFQKLRSGGKANAATRKSVRQELTNVESELDQLRGNPTAAPTGSPAGGSAMGVRDAANPADTAVCLHGEPHDLGQEVRRGFVSVVPVTSIVSIDPAHSGRLQLAQWLTSNDNPLTPRVAVNRMWGHLFGEGIVRTVDNFGSTGEAPANPALLDHLAAQFMQEGWSVKHMVREMVLSHAYQLGSSTSSANFAADPDDRLVWRMLSRRLDAEEIRDAMLAVGGKLDRAPPQGSLAAGLDDTEIRNVHLADRASDNAYRSVYLPILRDLVPPALDLFDFAEPTMVIGTRDTTTVATQALFLMNDSFVIEQARSMAARLQNAKVADDNARVDLAYHLALSRPASAAEKARVIRYINEFQHEAMYTTKDSLKNSRTDAWASFCQALLGSAEFRYLN